MQNVVLVIHLILSVTLIGIVLLQRSEGGGLGVGGGGGGAGGKSQSPIRVGGTGGAGVVILSVPTANYSGSTTGSPTESTTGDFTILTFTGSGSYTA